jgi:hypothetical protein
MFDTSITSVRNPQQYINDIRNYNNYPIRTPPHTVAVDQNLHIPWLDLAHH